MPLSLYVPGDFSVITVLNFNFILLWSENNYFQFVKCVESFLKKKKTVPGYDLSRYVFRR